jgi:cytochrome c peroxidase
VNLKLVVSIIIIAILSCTAEKEVSFSLPSHFPKPHYTLELNSEKFELGKQLFFDPIFSKDSTISCSSCHHQEIAFADSRPFSLGVRNQVGKRNAPALQNLMWSKSFFWDGGVGNIDLIPLNPITNHKELDESMINIVFKLNRAKTYSSQIKTIYQTDTINSYQVLELLTQYQAALISNQSKFDDYLLGKTKLSTEEMQGYSLFQTKCGQCHEGPLLSNYSFRNNGIYKASDTDLGRYEISIIESDKGKFKVPSLRNIELTAPFMHNSSLTSLEAVLNHYESGIHKTATLDSSLRNGILFQTGEKEKIIVFLKTLTDSKFLKNKRYKR